MAAACGARWVERRRGEMTAGEINLAGRPDARPIRRTAEATAEQSRSVSVSVSRSVRSEIRGQWHVERWWRRPAIHIV